jgi:uncharacterized protein (TIGR03382 family)
MNTRWQGDLKMQRHVLSAVTALVLAFAAVAATASADTVFQAGFEYSPAEPTVGANAANLNTGMTGLIGSFSGTLPAGSGGDGGSELVTFDDGPSSTRVMKLDRGVSDGTLTANLASSILVDGATVSFQVATRRTVGPGFNKDYEIIGFDASNQQAFHLRVKAASDLARLATITGGSTETYDLIAAWGGIGADANSDLPFTNVDPTGSNELATITLALGATGYTIDFVRDTRAYTTGLVPYNGAAANLTHIEFQFQGDPTSPNDQTGFFLDNLTVNGATIIPTPAALPAGLMMLGAVLMRRRR